MAGSDIVDEVTQQVKEKMKIAADIVTNAAEKITGAFGAINVVMKDMNISSDNLRSNMVGVGSSFDLVTKGLSTTLALFTKFDAFSKGKAEGGNVVSTMGDQFGDLIERAGGWEKLSARLAGKGFTEIAGYTEDAAKKFFTAASNAEHLENTFINLAGASGQMGLIFDKNNNIVSNLGDKVSEYGSMLIDTAAITNRSTADIDAFAAQLNTIPGVLGAVIKTGEGTDSNLSALASTMTIAKGSGRGLGDVLKTMQTAYSDLGNAQGKVTDAAQKGIDMFSLMSRATKDLGLRFDDTKEYLTKVAETFQKVGDNTQGAINVLYKYQGALQATGLTAKASTDIVLGMVEATKKMSIGTQALISMRSGGPGGLQGAFQVENLLRAGKTDEVIKMTENALKKQFGGRIYTQAEAGTSQQAASQFMRQRSMLQSGAFGSLAPDKESATRLLEAMAKGPVEAAKAITAAQATKDLTAQGNALQKNQVSVLNEINVGMDTLTSIGQQQLLVSARAAIGAGQEETRALLNTFRTSRKEEALKYKPGQQPLGLAEQQERQGRVGVADLRGGAIFAPIIAEKIVGAGKEMATHIGAAYTNAIHKSQEQTKIEETKANIARTGRAAAAGASMHDRAQEIMRQHPASRQLGVGTSAQTTTTMKHQVEPVQLNVNVKAAPGLIVTTEQTANKPTQSATQQTNNAVYSGGINRTSPY